MNMNPEIENRLDLRFYKGQDLYSDGEIEDRLLELVKTYPAEVYNEVIAKENSWPVLYHLSNMRENVLNWYPFRETDDVLEIGSGCGAVTGAFAGKVKSVTCVDLSKKRSLINAYKNRDHLNIKILVGNFEDVEPEGLGQYDVITLIGVLEYARYYIHAEDPFRSFLRKIEKHLKPNGRIILAIENRLGLKYWAGCAEDHVLGGYYEGIEGYPHRNGPQTFSRKELLELIGSAGDLETELYYPHPDYKLPAAMYSDSRLPKLGELKANRKRNFDQKRITSFDEDAVFGSLIENDLYPEFANSFIAVIRRRNENEAESARHCPVLSVKFSNERSPQYALMTKICCSAEGELSVVKQACDERGTANIYHIEESCRKLRKQFAGTEFDINRCSQISDGAVQLEFIRSDRTFADELNKLLRNKENEQLIRSVRDHVGVLKKVCKAKEFVPSAEFLEVFGDYSPRKRTEAVFEGICDIDLTFDNILLAGRRKTIIDYEWTFDFDIPLNYVAWRAVYFFFVNKDISAYAKLADQIYNELGITYHDRDVYLEMEKHFQAHVKGNYASLDDLYEEITPGYIDAKRVLRLDDPDVRSEGVPEADLQMDRLREKMDELNRVIERKNEQIDAIYKSTSWKITRPVRLVLDKIRGQEHRG